jgi:hypothetical protein
MHFRWMHAAHMHCTMEGACARYACGHVQLLVQSQKAALLRMTLIDRLPKSSHWVYHAQPVMQMSRQVNMSLP